jgi:uncharacterized protein YndB with AHSA1/START domain
MPIFVLGVVHMRTKRVSRHSCEFTPKGSQLVLDLDAATHLQHNQGMKTAIIPQVRVEPQLRADLDAVLRDGETLSEFVESTVRGAVEHRLVQSAFAARADEAWMRFQRTGAGRPAEDVIADMRTRLEAKRKELQSKHRPADA